MPRRVCPPRLTFIRIKPVEFMIGTPETEPGRYANEKLHTRHPSLIQCGGEHNAGTQRDPPDCGSKEPANLPSLATALHIDEKVYALISRARFHVHEHASRVKFAGTSTATAV